MTPYSIALTNPYALPSGARGETLLWLDDLPEELLRAVVARFAELDDATLFLAVIDCGMERSLGWLDDLIVDALAATSDDEVFRYAVLQAGARHRDQLIDAVVRRLDGTTGARKLAAVQESRAGR